MKGKIYPYNIHPVVEPDIGDNSENWQKDWEENCLCNTCKNNCIDTNCIVDACSSYEELKR